MVPTETGSVVLVDVGVVGSLCVSLSPKRVLLSLSLTVALLCSYTLDACAWTTPAASCTVGLSLTCLAVRTSSS